MWANETDHRTLARELIGMFVVFPILFGGGILTAVVHNAVKHADSFTFVDWLFQVGLVGCIALGVMFALPTTAWRELQRRNREQKPAKPHGEPTVGD